jgi:hypothetical protein
MYYCCIWRSCSSSSIPAGIKRKSGRYGNSTGAIRRLTDHYRLSTDLMPMKMHCKKCQRQKHEGSIDTSHPTTFDPRIFVVRSPYSQGRAAGTRPRRHLRSTREYKKVLVRASIRPSLALYSHSQHLPPKAPHPSSLNIRWCVHFIHVHKRSTPHTYLNSSRAIFRPVYTRSRMSRRALCLTFPAVTESRSSPSRTTATLTWRTSVYVSQGLRYAASH